MTRVRPRACRAARSIQSDLKAAGIADVQVQPRTTARFNWVEVIGHDLDPEQSRTAVAICLAHEVGADGPRKTHCVARVTFRNMPSTEVQHAIVGAMVRRNLELPKSAQVRAVFHGLAMPDFWSENQQLAA